VLTGLDVEISASDLPGLLRSYIASLPAPPESWTSLGPLLGGIKNSASDLK
jgi:glutaminyl-tRNA synthetase